MKRRDFLKLISMSVPVLSCGCGSLFHHHFLAPSIKKEDSPPLEDIGHHHESLAPLTEVKNDLKNKSLYFDHDFSDDLFCPLEQQNLLISLVHKFRAVQKHVGFGNFNLLGMDEFFYYAKVARGSSEITSKEKDFLEELFSRDAHLLGFHGDKVFKTFTDSISKKEVTKIAHSGHYLRRGKSFEIYQKIIQDVGNNMILTSGVRGVAKQFHLYLEKTLQTNFNLSRASRSLAPPGYSFHGKEDFDIGKKGMGLDNFTQKFASTREFKALSDLGYVDIRYEQMNHLGVRFEPWHIKI